MPRNRTVRLAVLGSSVQRAVASGYPSSRSSALKRRIVVGVLVVLSLLLITISFRSTALDGLQGTAASALRPFEIAADRVARPVRDTISWAHGLATARSQNRRLRREIQAYQAKLINDETALNENVQLREQLDYNAPPAVSNFKRIGAAVLVNPQSALDQSVTIAAGSSQGVAAGDAVVAPSNGLIGIVTKVWGSVASVRLLTDEESAVTSVDLTSPTAVGIVRRGGGSSDVLFLDRVLKSKPVNVGDTVITAGSLGKGALPSMFPHGLLIGSVASASDSDVNPFKTIQVQPAVDFSSLQSVIVLVPRR